MHNAVHLHIFKALLSDSVICKTFYSNSLLNTHLGMWLVYT
jgi:hypothetical protein